MFIVVNGDVLQSYALREEEKKINEMMLIYVYSVMLVGIYDLTLQSVRVDTIPSTKSNS